MRRQPLHPRTAVLNQKQQNLSKVARYAALNWLKAQFPEAFDNSLRIRPLKVGIMDDVLAHADAAQKAGISKSKLREAVVVFTRRIDYLTCLKAKEMRVDLQGESVAPVTEEEAEKASLKIRKRVEKAARNARKQLAAKVAASHSPRSSYTSQPLSIDHNRSAFEYGSNASSTSHKRSYTSGHDQRNQYDDRDVDYFPEREQRKAPQQAASVVVKHKQVRQFDPNAVARLKEKLGISRNKEQATEEVDH
ncbi:ProQ/FinO family protein [Legionella sp. W05-934-2]|jgi:ProP effector|uniref:ProQ/FinO family protein n=1 Tax=Legionella sp. W05-934-2 TaxID=1198649 RepID=UPI003462EAD8